MLLLFSMLHPKKRKCNNYFFTGIQIKALRRDGSDEASTLVKWLEDGAFDALNKKYVRAKKE